MTRSELLKEAIELFQIGIKKGNRVNINNSGSEFMLSILLAEQKRSEGCAFCTKHGEEHSFSLDGEFLVDHSDYGDNSSLRVYYCPLCGRDLTEGESV